MLMEWSGSNAENFSKEQNERNSNLVLWLGGTVKMSVAILRPLRKTRGLALTRKSLLELEVYSEGFIYKWYYDGCVNHLRHMGDSHEAACVNLRSCVRAVWNVPCCWKRMIASCWALERLYMFLVNTQFCILFFLYFDCISFQECRKKAVTTNRQFSVWCHAYAEVWLLLRGS